jgi:glucose-6-phosphate dehydrogenase assembly protein OpcA
MATYKVLGQSNPSATTATTLYTCANAAGTVVSTITICNQSSTGTTFRIAVRPAGATLAAQHYVAYDVAVGGNDSTALTLGLTLANTDVITVYAGTATCSFNAFGSEL